MNKGPSVGIVPAEGFAFFFAASYPAIARIGIAWAKRPKNIASPVVILYQSVFRLALRMTSDYPRRWKRKRRRSRCTRGGRRRRGCRARSSASTKSPKTRTSVGETSSAKRGELHVAS